MFHDVPTGRGESDNGAISREACRTARRVDRCTLRTVNLATLCRVHAFICVATLSLLAACERNPPPRAVREFTAPTMGTTYHVKVVSVRNEPRSERAAQACIDGVLASVDRHLSTYSKQSEITALNRNPSSDWIPVSGTLFAVLAAANRVSVETDGAFDVTVAPLVRLWGFGAAAAAQPTDPVPPSPEFVHDATALTGYTWLELRAAPERAVRKNRALELDVDGIAPGYAVDRISSCLARAGLPDHLVEIGGEVRAAGTRADHSPWRIAIERPIAGARQAYAGVGLTDLAISTSGSYRDFRRLPDGRVVSHTIDPRLGEPVRHALASVSVVHPRAQLADAYATALMVLGPDEGYAVAQRLGLPALMLERIGDSQQFRERATPEFERLRSPAQQASLSSADGSADEAAASTVHGAPAVPAAGVADGSSRRLLAGHVGEDDGGRADTARGGR